MKRPNVSKAIIGGFAGTLVMTMMMYAAPKMGMPKMDIAAMLGSMMSESMPAPMSGAWLIGMMMHFVNGTIIFPLIYALLLFRILPGPPLLRGLTWGLVLWLVAQLMVMPLMGMGIFSANSPTMMMSVMGSLIGHILYGAILGAIAGREASTVTQQEQRA